VGLCPSFLLAILGLSLYTMTLNPWGQQRGQLEARLFLYTIKSLPILDTLPSEIFNEIAAPLPDFGSLPPNTPMPLPSPPSLGRPPVMAPNPGFEDGFMPRPSPPFMRPPRQQTPSLPFARDMARFRYAPEMRREEQSLFPNQSGIASLMGQAYGSSMSRPNYQPMRQPPMRRPIMPRPPSRGKGGGYRPMPRPPSRGKGGGFPPIRTMR
jgi:hypothetical protein